MSFEKVPGRPIDVTQPDVWNKDLFYNWGQTMGKMHKLAGKMDASSIKRPMGLEANADIFHVERVDSQGKIKEKYQKHLKTLSVLPTGTELFGLIHNDFHQGNLRVNSGEITLFDFDDCAYYWFANNIAASFFIMRTGRILPLMEAAFPKQFFSKFFDGYAKERTVYRGITEQIPILLKQREFFYWIFLLSTGIWTNLKHGNVIH